MFRINSCLVFLVTFLFCYFGNTIGQLGETEHYDNRIWTILSGAMDNRLNYIDARTRIPRGYYYDVINAVCVLANKNCEIIYDDYSQCFANGFPQQGLSARWYDACAVFAHSADRARSVKFSLPLAQTPKPVFITRRGNPARFDPDNLSGAKIGLLRVWWSDAHCVFTLTGHQLQDSQIVFYTDMDWPTLNAGLLNGEVDAIFLSDDLPPATDGTFEVIKRFDSCLLGGESLMMRKDSLLKEWWDPAFTRLVNSRDYREICDDIDDPNAHGSQPGKRADEVCLNY